MLYVEAKTKEVWKLSPKTGRPPVENPKNVKMNIRISEDTAEKLKECAEIMNVPRVNVIEKGIELVREQLKKWKFPALL